MIRNLSNKNGPLVVISGSDVRTALQLDQAAYIDFALLLGTDFSQRIKNVGPQRALKFIREYRSIERVLECEPQYPPRIPQQIYLESVGLARMVFQTLPPPPEETLLQPGDMDEEAIFSILKAYNLSREVGENRWDFHSALNGNYFEDNPSAS